MIARHLEQRQISHRTTQLKTPKTPSRAPLLGAHYPWLFASLGNSMSINGGTSRVSGGSAPMRLESKCGEPDPGRAGITNVLAATPVRWAHLLLGPSSEGLNSVG
jgi:hypothetical protein